MKAPHERDSVAESVKNFWHLLISKDTRALLPFLALTGINVAFFSGFLSVLIGDSLPSDIDKDLKSQKTTYVFTTLGAAEICTGLVIGKITSLADNYTMARIGTIIVQVALVLSLVGCIVKSYALCFVIAVFWGCADCFFNSHACTICAADYSGIIEIFGVFRFCLAIACFVSNLLQVLFANVTPDVQYPYILWVFAFQIFTNYSCSFLKKPEEFKAKEIVDTN